MDNKVPIDAPPVYPPIGSGAAPTTPQNPHPSQGFPASQPQSGYPQQQGYPAGGVPPPYTQYSEIPLNNNSEARYYPAANVQQPTYYVNGQNPVVVMSACDAEEICRRRRRMRWISFFTFFMVFLIVFITCSSIWWW